jgi:hypothetical protein
MNTQQNMLREVCRHLVTRFRGIDRLVTSLGCNSSWVGTGVLSILTKKVIICTDLSMFEVIISLLWQLMQLLVSGCSEQDKKLCLGA